MSTTNSAMYKRLDVPANKWTTLDGFQVKYYNETIVNKLSLPLLLNLKQDLALSDVVHIQAIFNTPTPVALHQAQKLNKPVLLSPRGVLGDWIMENGNPLKKRWLKFFIRPFASSIHWHATSQQEKEEILIHYPDATVHVIPNGIDIEKIQKEITPTDKSIFEFYARQKVEGPVIVSMGRIHAKKGYDILIKSFKQLLWDFPKALLFIAGQDEGEQRKLEQLIQKQNLKEKVFFTGPLDKNKKINFLANADIFALPSHNENFGNVYLESIACGTPIVASTHTPWKEAEEYSCGLWVENSREDFYQAMKTILQNPNVYTKENCLKLANRYSWQSIGQMFSDTFQKMISAAAKK